MPRPLVDHAPLVDPSTGSAQQGARSPWVLHRVPNALAAPPAGVDACPCFRSGGVGLTKDRVRRRLRTVAAMAPSGEPHNVPEAPFDSTQSDLLDGKGPGPVIAVPQPAWAHADVRNVVIMSALHTVRVLSEVGLQTAITVDARRNVGDPLTLHGHLVVPPDDQRYLSEGGQIAKLPRTATRVEDQLASPRRGDANQCRLWCAVRPAGSYDR
jgi:hypothetical protein